MCFKRSTLFAYLHEKKRIANADSEDIVLFLKQAFGEDVKLSNECTERLRKNVLLQLLRRWKASTRVKGFFEKTNHLWLAADVCLEEPICRSPGGNRGRPALPFKAKVHRAKQSKVDDNNRSSWRRPAP